MAALAPTIRFDDERLIEDFTVMIRPLSSLERLRDVVTTAMTEPPTHYPYRRIEPAVTTGMSGWSLQADR